MGWWPWAPHPKRIREGNMNKALEKCIVKGQKSQIPATEQRGRVRQMSGESFIIGQ